MKSFVAFILIYGAMYLLADAIRDEFWPRMDDVGLVWTCLIGSAAAVALLRLDGKRPEVTPPPSLEDLERDIAAMPALTWRKVEQVVQDQDDETPGTEVPSSEE